MLDLIKQRCGIAPAVTVYDEDILMYIEDCQADMIRSGVLPHIAMQKNPEVLTAITLYVKAYLGDDRSDTDKYLDLYRKKVFRLSLDEVEECGIHQ